MVQVDGTPLLAMLVSPTEMQVNLPGYLYHAGSHTVTVHNLDPGGGTATGTFTILNTVPTLQGVDPAQTTASEGVAVLTLHGSNFNSTSDVTVNGISTIGNARYNPQPLSAGQMQIAIPVAAGGNVSLSVVNPGPGGGSSSVLQYPVLSQAPVLGVQAITSTPRDSGDAPFSLSGQGFNAASTVTFNGSDVGAIGLGGVWGTDLSFTIPAGLLHSVGSFPLTVTNPPPGGGSATVSIAVVNPPPALVSMSPAGAAAGAGSVNLTLTGSNFEPESVVYFNQQPISTTFESATALGATVPAAALAADGVYTVTVATPTPGGGTTAALAFGVGAGGRSVVGAAMPGGNRAEFTTTLLADGQILIAGGVDAQLQATNSAMLYDPHTDTFTATGSMHLPRVQHTATLLPDGKVLIAGGMLQAGGTITQASFTATAEIYDPSSGSFTATGSMAQEGAGIAAQLLPNGTVLMIGGYTFNTFSTTASEIYDPASGTFRPGPDVTDPQLGRARVNLLPSGAVLVSGLYSSLADLYDPQANRFTATGGQDEIQDLAPMAQLANGDLLVAGGITDFGEPVTYANAERYQAGLGLWEDVNLLPQPMFDESSTLLPNGQVLFAGGSGFDAQQGFLSTDELFDPDLNQFQYTGSLPGTLLAQSATLVSDGTVVLLGGFGSLAGNEVRFIPPPPAAPLVPTLASAVEKTLSSGTWVLVRGDPFFPGASVSFDGTAVSTTYLDPTLVSFQLPAGTVSGGHTLTVANPGGATSVPLTVNLP